MQITPDKRSDIIVIEQGPDRIKLRTKIASWWLGGAALIAVLAVVVYLLQRTWILGIQGDFRGLFNEWAGCLAMMAFLSLFLFALTHDRLEVTDGTLTYEWRLGPIALKRKSAELREITELASDSSTDSDGGGSFYLQIKCSKWEARFASDNTYVTIDEVSKEIQRLQKKG